MTINIRPQLPRVINKGLNSISILVKIAKIKTLSLEKAEGFTLVEPEAPFLLSTIFLYLYAIT